MRNGDTTRAGGNRKRMPHTTAGTRSAADEAEVAFFWPRMTTIYKICETAQWMQAERNGEFRGSAADLADGYIHFSTAAQAAETAAKHFAGITDLVLVAVEAEDLGGPLKWEPSRGG